jgi:signal peptidase II
VDGEVAVSGPVEEAAPPTPTPPAPPARVRGPAIAVLAGVAALVVTADAVAKQLVLAKLAGHAPVRLLGGLLYLDLTRNSGAAFSLGTRVTFVFPLVTLVVVAWIGWMATRLRSVAWAVALGLVLGAALGNLADRVFRAPGFLVGHVVDYASLFGPDGQYWPIFNIADAALSSGVVLAVLLELAGRRRDGTRTEPRRAQRRPPAGGTGAGPP